jgi:hypothetical protein
MSWELLASWKCTFASEFVRVLIRFPMRIFIGKHFHILKYASKYFWASINLPRMQISLLFNGLHRFVLRVLLAHDRLVVCKTYILFIF